LIVRTLAATLIVATCLSLLGGRCEAASLDTTPPVLTQFKAPKTFDASRAGNPLLIEFKATDDWSGVSSIQAFAVGPNYQNISVSFATDWPTGELAGAAVSWQVPATAEPGTYKFYSAIVRDKAGNYSKYEDSALDALGRTSFVLKNSKNYDGAPPTLQAGRILTPVVSVSSRHPGTNLEPRVGMSVDTIDLGSTSISGTSSVEAFLCQITAPSNCIAARAFNGRPYAAAQTLHLGNLVYPYTAVGDYHLKWLQITDWANNVSSWTSTRFGGTTDFSLYFPTTVITLVP
jgi:hypothetical protein